MQLTLKGDLPFTRLKVAYRGVVIEITDVLVDTGSATTILAADQVAQIGILPEPSDTLYTIRGVGGIETVFTRRVERLQISGRSLVDFEVEVGGMDYGFEINGILGMDFLMKTEAIINLRDLSLEFRRE